MNGSEHMDGPMDMKRSALSFPRTDPTPIFDAFRGNFSTELLTAAVAYFNVFEQLRDGPRSFEALRARCGLAERAAVVLFTVLRALNLLARNAGGELELTAQSREHLIPGAPFDVRRLHRSGGRKPGRERHGRAAAHEHTGRCGRCEQPLGPPESVGVKGQTELQEI
jgi:hypothetical protein